MEIIMVATMVIMDTMEIMVTTCMDIIMDTMDITMETIIMLGSREFGQLGAFEATKLEINVLFSPQAVMNHCRSHFYN